MLDLGEMMHFIRDVGVPLALVLFFVFRDWEREKNTAAERTRLTAFIQEKLVKIAETCADALAINSRLLAESTAAIRSLEHAVQTIAQSPPQVHINMDHATENHVQPAHGTGTHNPVLHPVHHP
jgi:ferric iron reductase protein FhuF